LVSLAQSQHGVRAELGTVSSSHQCPCVSSGRPSKPGPLGESGADSDTGPLIHRPCTLPSWGDKLCHMRLSISRLVVEPHTYLRPYRLASSLSNNRDPRPDLTIGIPDLIPDMRASDSHDPRPDPRHASEQQPGSQTRSQTCERATTGDPRPDPRHRGLGIPFSKNLTRLTTSSGSGSGQFVHFDLSLLEGRWYSCTSRIW
jgi:hypothetical protein